MDFLSRFLFLLFLAMVYLHVCLSMWVQAYFQGRISTKTLITGMIGAPVVVIWMLSLLRSRARREN
eukprot:1292-Eustigmatos_ZCMA.PRE.1